MWEAFELRIRENEQDRPDPLRHVFLDVLRNAGLRPGAADTKKMLPFEFGTGERLVWEVENPANFFLHTKFRDRIAGNGFDTEPRPYQPDKRDGGRHSGLSRSWSFNKAECFVVRVADTGALRRLLELLLQSGDMPLLDPAAISRWIERLRRFFPDLDRFDRPDPYFDSLERTYKLETAARLREALAGAQSDEDIAQAVLTALTSSNLLNWRVHLPLSPNGEGDRARLCSALRTLVDAALGDPDGHADALEAFVETWKEAVPNASADAARQIAEFLYLHLAPRHGIYIRYSVRQDFWQEAVGSRFPEHAPMAEVYRAELRFMQAVRHAFEERGLAPRDMIDVQSALWVVYDYKETDAATFPRDAIEAAMDAYDRYRQTGSDGEIFSAFGEPRDYWVRSTRERPDRVYPSRPIVGFLRGNARISGGWAQRTDAATTLYNAGYIIVDANDEPVAPPERHDHLIRSADRIQLCARNYYVEPARENGAPEVAIHVGDLARDMGLQDGFAAICSAIGSEKFQQLANVSPPSVTQPNNSSSTVFTFQLSAPEGRKTMSSATRDITPKTTNLILYGPPGTGKTYATAWEAVRLCLGDAAADALRGDRESLMAEYERLRREGRIEFVTFHQSYSYEDFVEGLRPTTGGESEGDEASAGFRLQPEPGIFKRISERAETGLSKQPTGERITADGRHIYKMSIGTTGYAPDQGLFEEAIEEGCTLLNWENIDFSDPRYEDIEAIRRTCEEQGTIEGPVTRQSGQVAITDMFRNRLKIDDIIIVSEGNSLIRAIGLVTGPYEYRPRPEGTFPHRRAVRWLWHDANGIPTTEVYDGKFTMRSLYQLQKERLNIAALERYMNHGIKGPGEKIEREAFVLIIDEINRANISKVFGELITLLEPDKRLGGPNPLKVRLPYSKEEFGVPANLHIIGTMNTADRSIALLDTALRRRFTFRELMPDVEALSKALGARGLDAENLDGINLCKLLTTLNNRIEYLFDREHQIGHAYFTGCRNRADVEDIMRHKVIPLLAEYFYEDWAKVAAVLGDGNGNHRFLEGERLPPPPGLADEEMAGEKIRWRVKDNFDFSEFAA